MENFVCKKKRKLSFFCDAEKRRKTPDTTGAAAAAAEMLCFEMLNWTTNINIITMRHIRIEVMFLFSTHWNMFTRAQLTYIHKHTPKANTYTYEVELFRSVLFFEIENATNNNWNKKKTNRDFVVKKNLFFLSLIAIGNNFSIKKQQLICIYMKKTKTQQNRTIITFIASIYIYSSRMISSWRWFPLFLDV